MENQFGKSCIKKFVSTPKKDSCIATRKAICALALVLSIHGQAQSQGHDSRSQTPPFAMPPPVRIKQLTVAEIGGVFERPTTVAELLKNLRLAVDKDLLLQKNFFVDSSLEKFLNGATVTREKPDDDGDSSYRAHIQIIDAKFPKITAHVIATSNLPTTRLSGYLAVTFEEYPSLTVHEVRDVFGPNARFNDSHFSPHGAVLNVTSKGALHYEVTGQRVVSGPARQAFQKTADFLINLTAPIEPSTDRRVTILADDYHVVNTDSVKSIRLYQRLENF